MGQVLTNLGAGPRILAGPVFGVSTSGEELTLDHAVSLAWDGTEEVVEERTRYQTVVRGAHLSGPEHHRFKGASVATALLRHWASGPKVQGTSTLGVPFGRAVVFPEDEPERGRQATVRDGVVRLDWMTHTSSTTYEGTVGVYPQWGIQVDEPVDADTMFTRFILPLLHLTGLATRRRDTITRAYMHREDGGTVEITSARWPSTVTEMDRLWSSDFLLPYETVKDRFQDVVPRWFALHDRRLARLTIAILGRSTEPDLVQDRFLARMRALEQWYLEFRGDGVRPIEKDRYNRNLATIEKLVDGDVWDVIEPRIANGNRPSLQMQVRELCDEVGWPIGQWASSSPTFIRHAVRHRDGLTHGFKKPPPFDEESLWWATDTIEALLIQLVLGQLGYNGDGDLGPDGTGTNAGLLLADSSFGQGLMDPRNPLDA